MVVFMTTELTNRATTTAAQDRRDGRWFMLIVLLIGQFMALLDVSVVNVAMPTIRTDLHASGAALQLIVSGYTVSYAMLLITGARLGDLYGRRRMFLTGVLAFTASSLLCGLAPTAMTLIVARFVQGAGAALMMPQIMSVIQVRFAGEARTRALSAYAAVLSIGGVAGMLVGGLLVNADLFGSGWRPVFLVNVPIGLIVAALVPRVVPADGARGTRRLDVLGLSIAIPAVCLVVLPLVLGRQENWPAWTFGCLAAGLVLAALFVRIERRVAARGGDPLLNLAVLRSPGMSTGLVALLIGMISFGALLFTLALHLQAGLGDSALRAGLTFAPSVATFGLFGFYWRRLPARIHHLLTPAGFILGAAADLAVALVLHSGTQGGALLLVGLLLLGAGMGAAFSPLVTHSLVNVPLAEAADASGLLTTTMQLGQVIGVATLGSLYLSVTGPGPIASAHAITTTFGGLAALLAIGSFAGFLLARTVNRARLAKG
jgi:MFS family permease